MKRTAIYEILKDGQNYYSLIIAISKTARKIVDTENEISGTCPDNPVEEAIEFLKSSEFEIVESDEDV